MTEHPGAGRNLVSGLIGLLAVTVAVLMGWSSSEARSVVVVHCGDVITQDTKLGNDLVDCPADGLVIGADDVTLDLHGHTIDGVGQGTGIVVDNQGQPGPDRATLQNGFVREFNTGVSVSASGESHIRKLKLSANPGAILAVNSPNAWIEQNNVQASGFGIRTVFGGSERIEDNRVTGGGIGISNTAGAEVTGNVLQNGGIIAGTIGESRFVKNVVSSYGTTGIDLCCDARDNLVQQNKVSGGSVGIRLSTFSTENEIRGNVVAGNSEMGIRLGRGGSELVPNRVDQNVVYGNGEGILDEDDGSSVVAGNRIYRNLTNGVDIGQPVSKFRILDNRLSGNGGDGILVGPSCCTPLIEGNAVIDGNTSRGNGDDGVEVDQAPITLTGNTLRKNGDLGIEAIPGTIDGGGNRAFQNGNVLQCLNVACGP